MPLFHLLLVAIIQGVTEFLPVSSSGHLILLPNLAGLDDQGQVIDVSVHVGTLFAVVLYFWRDVGLAILGLPRLLTGRVDTPGSCLAMLLLAASIPVVALGLLLHLTGLDAEMRSIKVIGWAMLVFGIVLYWADQAGPGRKKAEDWNLQDAMVIGVWQAIALIPGTSRSGITITGARFLGYTRRDAARLSMLMSIPTIIASGVLLGAESVVDANVSLLREGLIAAAMAFGAALLALSVMMRLLNRVSFTPYVIYRIVLGIVLLVVAYR
ncbi:undecaprenyl-diphosphatase [Roseovarius halotolerans]|uniref:Undecaprenyl-diphosphatase n=1 Tax=Roseovarius halotolerans TaxID=505353 RepID=A0A1X6Z4L9_9RHOB|nr:undecaprenyl-diphosphate phosphatase [Roseovarius halotolerans]RKT32231.1 undecaprenyl-diphosphatase [Roseovarius halotolerans]SLN39988.1 Undecaprenyl-diphosphatase [Roseovarius halotolerans]